MSTKCPTRTSATENKCPVPRVTWGHVGCLTAIVGVFAFLIMNNGPLGAANNSPAESKIAGQGVVTENSNATTAALLSQGRPAETRPIQPPSDAAQLQADSTARSGGLGLLPSLALGNIQAGAGRCDTSDVCHYSMALIGAEAQMAERSEAGTAVSLEPICAAKDLDATTRTEQVGTIEVPSDKLC
ncbi:hypothetical protein DFP91_3044 [Pseudorhodoplanes sinuspersici]|nr:hypothetical protein DFP91_3044 [Pseudorhodoplanes sinuspersici]